MSSVIVSGPGEGEEFDRGNRVITLKAELGELSVNEIAFDPHFSVPPHRHGVRNLHAPDAGFAESVRRQ